MNVKSIKGGNSGNTVTESRDDNYFKDKIVRNGMVDKFKKFISALIGNSRQSIDRTRPQAPRTIPDIRLRVPKANIPDEIKRDFQRTWRMILEDEKKGVVRRKRYGSY